MTLLAMVKGGSDATMLRWVFVICGCAWVSLALAKGLLGKPGPKLQGTLRKAYSWMHWGLYTLILISALANLAALVGLAPQGTGWTSLLVLLMAGTFHGLFHLWRHNALFDGSLRNITPRFMHKIL